MRKHRYRRKDKETEGKRRNRKGMKDNMWEKNEDKEK
jgi:hypothetical protein